MPVEDSLESARQCCLKQLFGGSLTTDEELDVRRFLATDEGRAYRHSAEEMRLRLKEIVVIQPRPIEAAEMTRRLEEMIREKARVAVRSMWMGAVALVAWFAMSLWLILAGPGFTFKGWFSLLTFLFFAWVGVALRKKNRDLVCDPDLILSMRRDQALLRQFRTQLNGWILCIFFVGGMGLAWYLDSGTEGLLQVVIPMTVGMVLTPLYMKLLRRKEKKLWDWWEGT